MSLQTPLRGLELDIYPSKRKIMKLKSLMVGGLLSAAFTLTSPAQLSSKNAAGYAKRTVPAGGLDLFGQPFENFPGLNKSWNDMLGVDNLPPGSIVYYWDAASQGYGSVNFVSNPFTGIASWQVQAGGPNGPVRGDSYFMYVPSTGASANYDFYMYGEVPDEAGEKTTLKSFVGSGLSFFTNPYPTDIDANTSVLKDTTPPPGTPAGSPTDAGPQSGDIIYLWDTVAQGYYSYNFVANPFTGVSTWNSGAPSPIEVSQGAIYYRPGASARDITFGKGYVWP